MARGAGKVLLNSAIGSHKNPTLIASFMRLREEIENEEGKLA